MSFQGFKPETIKFLIEIEMYNNRQWYADNKKDYNEFVLSPFRDLVTDLSSHMLQIDPLFEVRPAVDKTISRIYRDTRFSKNKSLYRSNVWITFKRPKNEWAELPAFFFEIFPDWYRYGMGYYSAKRDSMDTLRKMIDEKPQNFLEAVSFFRNQEVFALEGDRYKKDIVTKSDETNEWYNRKNLFVVHNDRNIRKIFSRDILDELVSGFNTLTPIYNYLCKVEERKLRERNS